MKKTFRYQVFYGWERKETGSYLWTGYKLWGFVVRPDTNQFEIDDNFRSHFINLIEKTQKPDINWSPVFFVVNPRAVNYDPNKVPCYSRWRNEL